LLPGRNYSSDSYRFGFQGQEKDGEINGATGTSYAFEFRMHDPRIGRFLSIDPLAIKYPYNSPYAFAENKLGLGVELEGLELKTIRGTLGIHPNGDVYIKKIDWVQINESAQFYGPNGEVLAKTLFIYNWEGDDHQFMTETDEPVDYGTLDPRLRGLKPSAAYDYTSESSKAQKMADDQAFVDEHKTWWDPLGTYELYQVTNYRDDNAPDAVYDSQGLVDVMQGGEALAGGKFLFFGKYKARRDLFHPSGGGGIKDNILDAAGRKQFGRIVGDNPDIKVVKDKIVLSGRGDRFKGKEFETGLNAADYLDGQ